MCFTKVRIESIGGDSIYEVYIDTYFLFNFWMNLWVLFLCRYFLHSKVKKIKVIIASFLASLVEAVLLCIPLGGALIKLLVGFGGITAFIVAWLFRPGSWKYYQKMLMYSYLAATFFGGSFLLLDNFSGGKKVSLRAWLIIVIFLYFFIVKIVDKVSVRSDFCEVVVTIGENCRCSLYALVDSGNGLMDPISGVPVSLVEESAIAQYKDKLQKEKFRIIPYHSVGNPVGILEAYFVEGMVIKKDGEKLEIKNPLIAVTNEVISANKRYQMILHPTILEQGGK